MHRKYRAFTTSRGCWLDPDAATVSKSCCLTRSKAEKTTLTAEHFLCTMLLLEKKKPISFDWKYTAPNKQPNPHSIPLRFRWKENRTSAWQGSKAGLKLESTVNVSNQCFSWPRERFSLNGHNWCPDYCLFFLYLLPLPLFLSVWAARSEQVVLKRSLYLASSSCWGCTSAIWHFRKQ